MSKLVFENAFIGYDEKNIKIKIGADFTSQRILHFLPSDEGTNIKKINWYGVFKNWKELLPKKPPSKTKGFDSWKTPNPRVLQEHGINVFEVMTRLKKIGTPVKEEIKEALLNNSL